jgi:endo-1,4-beta-D-glucanase Y
MSSSDAQSAYDSWKAGYLEDCGENGLRVIGPTTTQTLSEGIGFGALLAAAWGDRATFDGLWTYYQKAAAASDAKKNEAHGLMGWLVESDACGLSSIYPGSASYADLDMAMALVQGACQWSDESYFAAAFRLVSAIKAYTTSELPNGTLLLPDDSGSAGCMNPSYFSPGYYRVFAQAFPDDAAFWNKMADDTYGFLELASNPTTGLASDWAPSGTAECDKATDFVGYDGVRTSWRVDTDYVWFGTPAAKSWLDRVTTFAQTSIGVDKLGDLRDGFFTDGSEIMGPAGAGNSAFVGAFAVGAMSMSQEVADAYHGVFLAISPDNDASYYPVTARALYMLLGINRFMAGCF